MQQSEAALAATEHQPLRLVLAAWMVAGVETQYQHLLARLPGEVEARTIEARPYVRGGWVERLPLPSSTRGTVRSTLTLARALTGPRPDAVWAQLALPMLPFALWRRRVPIAYAIDCTPELLWEFRPHYAITDPASRKGRLIQALYRRFFRHCGALLPWSYWAARSMVHTYGADPDRVHVIAPGVDLERWRPGPPRPPDSRPQLLFVGGDFGRKGGHLLLGAFRAGLRDRCDLHMVTRARLSVEPGVHVYRGLGPGDPELLALYQSCDILVVPTLADCFSMAALEAMACGLPVVTSAVGGIPEVVVDGETGALLQSGNEIALARTLDLLVGDPALRARWGAAGRRRAEARFDAAVQARATVRVLAELAGRPC